MKIVPELDIIIIKIVYVIYNLSQQKIIKIFE